MRLRLIAAVAAVALVLAACGNSDDDDASDDNTPGSTAADVDTSKFVKISGVEGVTDDEIQVATITSKTNNPTGTYAPLVDGIKAYFAKVNSEGGMYGRDLVVKYDRDDQFGSNRQTVQQSLNQDNAFATFMATTLFTGADLQAKSKRPLFMWNINAEFAGHPTFFANVGAICFTCAGHLQPWLAQELGADKVGVLAYDVPQSASCAEGLKNSFEKYPSAEIAYFDDSLAYQQPLQSQVEEMKKKGVKYVMTCVDGQESYTLGKEMKQQNMDAVQALPYGYDADFIAKNGEFLESAIVSLQFVALENEPQIQEIKDLYEWTKKTKVDVKELTAVGWQIAAEFVHGLTLAGPEFNQEKLVSALNTVTDFSDNGFIPPLDWTKQHTDPIKSPEARTGRECANYVKVENGKLVPAFGEDEKPWVCFDSDDPTTDNPERVSFVPE